LTDRNPFSRSFWRSPRPPHAFVLGRDRLVYVGPQDAAKKAVLGAAPALRVALRALPADALTPGPGDVPIAGPAVAGALQRLLAEVGVKIQAASLVVPDGFAKLLAVDVEDPERNHRETEEMIAWKFGRTFGEPAPPLRLSWHAVGPGVTGTRILALAVPEPAAASWEAPFEKAGIRIGALETGAFAVSALAKPAPVGDSFLVWADGDTATALFYADGALRFARSRPAFGDAEESLHEIRLAAAYLRAGAGGDELTAPCAAGPAGAGIVEALAAFRRTRGADAPAPLALPSLVPGASVTPDGSASDPAILMGLGALAGER
jgi:hypothetical protein